MTQPNPPTTSPKPSLLQSLSRSLRVRWSLGGLVLGLIIGSLIGGVGLAGRGGAVGLSMWMVCGLVFAAIGYGVGLQHRLARLKKSLP